MTLGHLVGFLLRSVARCGTYNYLLTPMRRILVYPVRFDLRRTIYQSGYSNEQAQN
jgi:hypothetical protein